jgi:hypothetical protein
MAQKTLTAAGNVEISTDDHKYGLACGEFPGAAADVLTALSSDDYNILNGDFSIDTWIKWTSLSNDTGYGIVEHDDGATGWWLAYIHEDNIGDGPTIYLRDYQSGVKIELEVVYQFTIDNLWHHLAVESSGGNHYVFVDGQSQTLTANTWNTVSDNSADLLISPNDATGNNAACLLDEFRIRKGAAIWTSNFTPPGVTYYNALDILRLHFEGADESTTFIDSSADSSDVPTVANNNFFMFMPN